MTPTQRILERALLAAGGMSYSPPRRARWPEERLARYALVALAVATLAALL